MQKAPTLHHLHALPRVPVDDVCWPDGKMLLGINNAVCVCVCVCACIKLCMCLCAYLANI